MNWSPLGSMTTKSTASMYSSTEDNSSSQHGVIDMECGDGTSSVISDVPSVDRSVSDSSESSSHHDALHPLGSGAKARKPLYLRQRNSGVNGYDSASSPDPQEATPTNLFNGNNSNHSSSVMPAVAADFIPQFLLPQNSNAPIPKGPAARIRKDSDFEQTVLKESSRADHSSSSDTEYTPRRPIASFRDREEIVLHFMIELNMLRRDALIVFPGIVMQWVHSVFTNVAYYYHTQLSAAQRTPLKDVAYEYLPLLTGSQWMWSEYIVFTMVGIIAVSIASILFVRWNPPHGRPLYCVPILRRMLMTWCVCQTLRCISFLITTLPGASRQCAYTVPADMTALEMIHGPAPDRGNSERWSPPATLHDILWGVDATNGCGDLMFSSHTIFTMSFVLVIWRYFNFGILKWFMAILQVMIVPLILAAHKHYSIDVFTALYVTPLIWEYMRIKFRDMDMTSADMASHYGIRFHRSYSSEKQGGQTVVMSMGGGEFYVDPVDIPLDLQRNYAATTYRKLSPKSDLDLFEEGFESLSEFDPIVV